MSGDFFRHQAVPGDDLHGPRPGAAGYAWAGPETPPEPRRALTERMMTLIPSAPAGTRVTSAGSWYRQENSNRSDISSSDTAAVKKTRQASAAPAEPAWLAEGRGPAWTDERRGATKEPKERGGKAAPLKRPAASG